MKNLRLYQTEGDYTSDPITREYPTVSYCKETDTVHIEKKSSYFISTYNVTSTTEGIQLLGQDFNLSNIKEMYIDNVKQETVVATYTFTTTGTHIIKCVMVDNVTTMYGMFYECSGLTTLDVSNFNTSSITDMSWVFCRCIGLTSLNLSNFNTSNVTTMYNMFLGCSGLTSLDVSNFNTSNVTIMQSMFNGCNNLTSIDLSSFNTSNVTVMASMFSNCGSLTSLDLSNFNTSSIVVMSQMFRNCSRLTSVTFGSQADISNALGLTAAYMAMFNGITTTGTFYYPSAYADAWNTIIVTNQSTSNFPSTWTAVAVD